MPIPAHPALRSAAHAAGLAHVELCGGVVLDANGFLLRLEDGALLVYDNNGRAAGHQHPAPAGADLVATLHAIAARPRVLPQVRIAPR